MDVNRPYNTIEKIKYCLVFFCMSLVVGCELGEGVQGVEIDYEDQKAVGVTFRTTMDVEQLRIFIGEVSQTSVIGVIVSVGDKHSFSPVIPFTPGQTYTLRKADTLVMASFRIPNRASAAANALVGLYPSVATVPENLLKMYFEFAQPMQAVGNALDFITVTDMADSTEIKPFLKLESELWNKERTVLTLWLDPGRIKTGLIPNKQQGLPIKAGKSYEIKIDSNWKSSLGTPLKQHYTKAMQVGPRDDKRPEVKAWQLHSPAAGSRNALRIDFGEPMDAFLARETLSIIAASGTVLQGEFELENNDYALLFIPVDNWLIGDYDILIQSRLEDLAGNNLNRLFDTELRQVAQNEIGERTRSISFTVH